jgi:hypothetical protein
LGLCHLALPPKNVFSTGNLNYVAGTFHFIGSQHGSALASGNRGRAAPTMSW